jgi:hypothetical protein
MNPEIDMAGGLITGSLLGGSIIEIPGSYFGLSLENSHGTKVTIGAGDV